MTINKTLSMLLMLTINFLSFDDKLNLQNSQNLIAFTINLKNNKIGFYKEERNLIKIENKNKIIYKTKTLLLTQPNNIINKTISWINPINNITERHIVENMCGSNTSKTTYLFDNNKVHINEYKNNSLINKHTIENIGYVMFSKNLPLTLFKNSKKTEHNFNLLNVSKKMFEKHNIIKLKNDFILYKNKKIYCCKYVLTNLENKQKSEYFVKNNQIIKIYNRKTETTYNYISTFDNTHNIHSDFIIVPKLNLNDDTISYMDIDIIFTKKDILSISQLQNNRQRVVGKIKEGVIKANFKVKKEEIPLNLNNSNIDDISKIKYLKETEGIECFNPILINESKKITNNLIKIKHITHSIGLWINKNIKIQTESNESALQTFKDREGTYLGGSRLFVALCRSVNIPSRVISGIAYGKVNNNYGFYKHYWVEIILNKNRCYSVDPFLGEYDYISAGHIKIGENDNFKIDKINILNYIPKTEKERNAVKISNFRNNYTPGRSYKYSYYIKNKKRGTYILKCLGKETVNNIKVNRFNIKIKHENLNSESTVLIDNFGRVIYYNNKTNNVICKLNDKNRIECYKNKKRIVYEGAKEGFFVDSNQIYFLGNIISKLTLSNFDIVQIGVFSLAHNNILQIQVEFKGKKAMPCMGKTTKLLKYEITGDFNKTEVILKENGCLVEVIEHEGLIRHVLEKIEG